MKIFGEHNDTWQSKDSHVGGEKVQHFFYRQANILRWHQNNTKEFNMQSFFPLKINQHLEITWENKYTLPTSTIIKRVISS